MTPFGAILQRAVDATPHGVGAAFAAWDGEMVDAFTHLEAFDWAVLTAHYGVILTNLYAAFGTWHFGGPEVFIARHAKLDVIVHTVDASYYTLMAIERTDGEVDPCPDAIATLAVTAAELRKEML